MRNIILKLTCLAIFLTGSALFAQKGFEQNEDLQYIKNFIHQQKLEGLADALQLTEEQVDTLKSVRGAVDAVKAEFEGRQAENRAAAEATFATVRTNIEATGELTEEDQTALADVRTAARMLGREIKMRVGAEMVQLEGLLTDEQKEAMRAFFQADRGNQNRGKRQAANAQGQGNGNQDRAQRNGAGRALRILLSDDFLALF